MKWHCTLFVHQIVHWYYAATSWGGMLQNCSCYNSNFNSSLVCSITKYIHQVALARRQRRDHAILASSCQLLTCLPYTVEASRCPFIIAEHQTGKLWVPILYSLWFDLTRNWTQVFHFSSRCSVHSTTDQLCL